jgi:hypothetical protein
MLQQGWWFMAIFLVMWEAEIGRIKVQSQPKQTVHETLSQKYPLQEIPRWRLEGGSRKQASYSEILERR